MNAKAKPGKEQWSSERCYITELLNHENRAEVSIARTRVEPGVTTQLHALSVREWYIIESGHGRMSVDGSVDRDVGSGDVVTIAKHRAQKIVNTGAHDLIFLCICVPRFSHACYTSLE